MSLIRILVVSSRRPVAIMIALAFFLLLIPRLSVAQSQDSSSHLSADANSGSAIAPAADNATILRELAAMKQRIAELEAQLNAQKSAADTATGLRTATQQLLPAQPASGSQQQAAIVASSVVQTVPPTIATTGTPEAAPAVDTMTPFADSWWGWLNGNPRTRDCPLCTKYFTPEIRVDTNYNLDFNHPADDTISGSSEVFRSQEVQLEQLGVGGDLLIDHVHARLMTQFGEYSVTTPRNDASVTRGQWNLDAAYRYLAEGYGGYHWDHWPGINLDAGIFMSYIGLFSYYNFDNWAYQPSFVSSNTPWFFNGVRGQIFPTQHLKIEPWIINGWQSYASANSRKGLGGQIKYTPYPWLNFVSNNYGLGHDDLYTPNRGRIHTDNSLEIKYYEKSTNLGISKMAFT